jgi:hypothetical protein
MSIRFQCECGTKIRVPETASGKKGKCPGCGQAVIVPDKPIESPAPEIKTSPKDSDPHPPSQSEGHQETNVPNPVVSDSSEPVTPQVGPIKSESFFAKKKMLLSAISVVLFVIATISGIKINERNVSPETQVTHAIHNDTKSDLSQEEDGLQNENQADKEEVNHDNPKTLTNLTNEAKVLHDLMIIHRDYYRRLVYHRSHIVDVRDGVAIQEDKQEKLYKLSPKILSTPNISAKFIKLFSKILIFNQTNLVGHAQFVSYDLKNAHEFNQGVIDSVGPKNDAGGIVKGFFALQKQSMLMQSLNKFRKIMVPEAEILQKEWNELVLDIVKKNPQLKSYIEDPEICTPLAGVFLPALEIPKEKIGVVYPIKGVSYPNPFQLGEIHKPVIINIGSHNKSWHYIFYFKCNKKKTPINYELSGIQGDVCMRILVSAGAGQYSDGIDITVTGTPGSPPRFTKVSKKEGIFKQAPFKQQFKIPHKAGYLLVLSHAHHPGFGPTFGDTGAKIKIWTDDNPEPNHNSSNVRVIKISGDPEERFAHYEKELKKNTKFLRDNISLENEFACYLKTSGSNMPFFKTNSNKLPFYFKPKVNPETGKVTGTITWLQFDPKYNVTTNFEGEFVDNRLKIKEKKILKQNSDSKKNHILHSYFVDYKSTKNLDSAQGYELPIKKNSNREIFIQLDRSRSTINNQILTALEKSKNVNIPIKGVARGSYRKWPFKMTIKTIVKERGVFTGEINWTTLDSIHKFTGKVSKGIITFKETKAIKKGKAFLGTEYHLEVHDEFSMHGSYIDKNKKKRSRGGFAGRRKKKPLDTTVSLYIFSKLK